ncbi:hypothetical protein [Salinicoccus roseus]|uniref:hypothetical protein n=1 Tax=Salinicoccus roseus TaxID=45670 RepID=UPI000F4D89E9|nr:hypothetical protein [Salinicoccus roseus]GGA70555.1 hypothetical protein GCM10007176_13530 [Salinicoccus roseus]
MNKKHSLDFKLRITDEALNGNDRHRLLAKIVYPSQSDQALGGAIQAKWCERLKGRDDQKDLLPII